MKQLLLVSNRLSWCEGLGVALGMFGDVPCRTSSRAELRLPEQFVPTAAVIDTNEESVASHSSVEETARAMAALRKLFPALPMVLLTDTPRDDICDLAIDIGGARALIPERIANPERLSSEVLDAIDNCPRLDRQLDDARSATVEITIRQASVDCDVRVDGVIRFIGPRAFTSREHLKILNLEFQHYESTAQNFRRMVDVYAMSLAGQRARAALQGPLEIVRRFQPKRLPRPELLQYRFALADGDLEFVPFEAMPTANENEYLRDVHPFARRLLPREEHRDADQDTVGDKPRLRVLFIASRAAGVLSVPFYKFKMQDSIVLKALPHIDDELKTVSALYGSQARILDLDVYADKVGELEKAFDENEFDVVHFAGHSARADGPDGAGKVYLALPPGPQGNTLTAYPAERLAMLASNGHTRLVILSSCEGCSGTTLSRMASWGVPAVAGFRWVVEDQDASLFTNELHRQLQRMDGPIAVSLAFHRALASVKARNIGVLSPFSPVLMLQRSTWHDFHLGN